MSITNEQRSELIERALEVRELAYAPYSNYAVGAALLTSEGDSFQGVNVENAAYPAGMCAERSALFQAVSHGKRDFEAIAVASHNGGSPCGSCRQVLSEFNLAMIVILVDDEGQVILETTVADLIPEPFGPVNLT